MPKVVSRLVKSPTKVSNSVCAAAALVLSTVPPDGGFPSQCVCRAEAEHTVNLVADPVRATEHEYDNGDRYYPCRNHLTLQETKKKSVATVNGESICG
jgi:hypothetical protein